MWGGLISVAVNMVRGLSVVAPPLRVLALMVMVFLFLVRARPRLLGLLPLR